MKRRFLFSIIAILIFSSPIDKGWAQSSIDRLLGSGTKKYEKVKVKKVIKADLFELESGEKMQMIGLNAPEPPEDMHERYVQTDYGIVIEKRAEDPRYTVEENSYLFASEMLEGKFVRLEFDEEKTDDKFHTLAYVFLADDGTFVNTEILRHGYAQLSIRPPNMKHAKELREAYQDARKNFRGLQSN